MRCLLGVWVVKTTLLQTGVIVCKFYLEEHSKDRHRAVDHSGRSAI